VRYLLVLSSYNIIEMVTDSVNMVTPLNQIVSQIRSSPLQGSAPLRRPIRFDREPMTPINLKHRFEAFPVSPDSSPSSNSEDGDDVATPVRPDPVSPGCVNTPTYFPVVLFQTP
jgi:hypothetical protein